VLIKSKYDLVITLKKGKAAIIWDDDEGKKRMLERKRTKAEPNFPNESHYQITRTNLNFLREMKFNTGMDI